MVEMASAKFVCIVDDSKMVEGLGGSKLAMPVEITQFCHLYTLGRLQVSDWWRCCATVRCDVLCCATSTPWAACRCGGEMFW
jgi:ribose 5-phosphate isomerase